MTSFVDIFKKGFLENSQLVDLSLNGVVLTFLTAFLNAMLIYVVYKFFYRGIVYNSNFNVLLVMVALVTSFIVMAISSNILLSLGMVGALSIVRFRTAVKDPLDVGFLFFAIAVGITSGAGLYIVAFVATVFISLVYILIVQMRPSAHAYLLIVKFDPAAHEEVQRILLPMRKTLKNKTSTRNLTELTYEVRFRGQNTAFVTQLADLEGVRSSVLVEYTGDFGE